MKEPSCKIFRRNKNYYFNELKQNAIRSKKKGYDVGRGGELAKARKERRERVGNYGRKKWTRKEEQFLIDNKGGNYSELAIKLNRSLSSVEHKIERLGLQKYNNWKKIYEAS